MRFINYFKPSSLFSNKYGLANCLALLLLLLASYYFEKSFDLKSSVSLVLVYFRFIAISLFIGVSGYFAVKTMKVKLLFLNLIISVNKGIIFVTVMACLFFPLEIIASFLMKDYIASGFVFTTNLLSFAGTSYFCAYNFLFLKDFWSSTSTP